MSEKGTGYPQRRRSLDSALDAVSSVIDSQREHTRIVRDQLNVQEKLCASRHALSLSKFPNWLRWAVAFIVVSWLLGGIGMAIWVSRVADKAEVLDLKIQRIERGR